MKYLFPAMLIACFCLCGQASGQKARNGKIPPPPVPPADFDPSCYKVHHYILNERLQHYPFSKARGIALASFRDARTYLIHADSLEGCKCADDSYSTLPDPNDSLHHKSLFEEIKMLDEPQVDSLTAILYNYDYKEGQTGPTVSHGCYYPHNAILFYNREGAIFAFIELCFACSGKRLSDKKINTGSWCAGKYDLLQAFFRQQGIKIGLDQIPVLPEALFSPRLNTK